MLMWLLAVALPLQGVSAATMAACGVGHHGGASASSQTVSPESRQVHGHDASMAREHAGAIHAHSTKSDLPEDVAHKCSACASCCLGAAVPTPTLSFDTARLTAHFAPLVARTLAAFVTEGLERPPRSFLA